MTSDEFRDALDDLNLTQVGAAKMLNLNPRTVRRYASGDWEIPTLVELALEGLAARMESEDD